MQNEIEGYIFNKDCLFEHKCYINVKMRIIFHN